MEEDVWKSEDDDDDDDDGFDWLQFLPRELWEKCFDYLNLTDLASVAQTCVQFSIIASEPRFWRRVDLGHEWMRFIRFDAEFIGRHLAHSTSFRLFRTPGFEFRNEDAFLSSLSALPIAAGAVERTVDVVNQIRFTNLDFSAAYVPNIRCDVISAQNASDRLAHLLAPLNVSLQNLKFPKGPQFSRFLTSLLSSLPATSALLPNLVSLSGSFLTDDIKLLPSLPRLTTLHLDGHVYKDANAVTLHVLTKLEPTYLWPLLDCPNLRNLSLPLIDAKFVSLFSPSSQEPSPLALNLETLTLHRVHGNESFLHQLLSSCSGLTTLTIRELRIFNPHHMNPFANFSPHLRRLRISFPRDGDLIPEDLESHLLSSLAALPRLDSVDLDGFSSRPHLVANFSPLHPVVRSITFRCQSSHEFVGLIALLEKLDRLENLHLNFPETHVDDDAVVHCFVHFVFGGKFLRIRGEASPYVLKLLTIRPPSALSTLDVGTNTLGLALLKWPSTVTPCLNRLEELLLQVESPWHEDVLREILAATIALRTLHVVVASGGESAVRREVEDLRRDAATGPGVASGAKTFFCVFDFLEKNETMEDLNLTFATPLPYQLSGCKLTVDIIKERLIELKNRVKKSARLKSVNVNIAVVNSLPWKMQLVKDCLGRWVHHF